MPDLVIVVKQTTSVVKVTPRTAIVKVTPPVRPVIKVLPAAPLTLKVLKQDPATAVVRTPGPRGFPGPQNLFVQQTQPNFTGPGIWVELNPDGTVKTIWVNNAA